MGGTRPTTKLLEAATSSGRFSSIALELYELLLCSPNGASVEAVASKSHLMNLDYIRAEVTELHEGDLDTKTIAKATRSAIKQASYKMTGPIRQRDKGLDYGGAARIYLCLSPGTEKWSLGERRQAAAKKLGRKDAYSLSKTRYAPTYEPSYELELLEALSKELTGQESVSRESVSRSPASTGDLPYKVMSEAWIDARSLYDHLYVQLASRGRYIGDLPKPDWAWPSDISEASDDHIEFLWNYYYLTRMLDSEAHAPAWEGMSFEQIANDPIRLPFLVSEPTVQVEIWSPLKLISANTPRLIMWMFCHCSPLRSDNLIVAVEGSVSSMKTFGRVRKEFGKRLDDEVTEWLDSCECVDQPRFSAPCYAHWLLYTGWHWMNYIKANWELIDEYRKSPETYFPDIPREMAEKSGLRLVPLEY